MSAKRSSSRPSISHISHSGLERSSCWEKIRAVSVAQLLPVAGRGQRGVADVVLEVEARVVDPHRPAAVERRVGELAGGSGGRGAGAAGSARGAPRSVGGGPSKIVSAADVHVRVGALLVQERGVDWGQPVEVASVHQPLRRTCVRPYNGDAVSEHRREAAARGAARLLRGRRPGRADRRTGAGAFTAPPVYVRKEIVHNKHVVEQLREARRDLRRGARPRCRTASVTVFSAHGVAPSVRTNAQSRGLQTIDATCPLVTKVHVRGAPVRGRGLHDRAGRPRRPRGGRGHDGRGARPHRARPDRAGRRRAGAWRIPRRSPTSRRRRCRSMRRAAIIERLRERFPGDRRPPHRRHLLRDDQSPGGRRRARDGM